MQQHAFLEEQLCCWTAHPAAAAATAAVRTAASTCANPVYHVKKQYVHRKGGRRHSAISRTADATRRYDVQKTQSGVHDHCAAKARGSSQPACCFRAGDANWFHTALCPVSRMAPVKPSGRSSPLNCGHADICRVRSSCSARSCTKRAVEKASHCPTRSQSDILEFKAQGSTHSGSRVWVQHTAHGVRDQKHSIAGSMLCKVCRQAGPEITSRPRALGGRTLGDDIQLPLICRATRGALITCDRLSPASTQPLYLLKAVH